MQWLDRLGERMPRKTSPAHQVSPAPAVTLDALAEEVRDLARFRDELTWRVKVGVGVVAALLGLAGIDAFLTRVFQAGAQKYLAVPTRQELRNIIWTEMADQVATSYGAAFTLGTLAPVQDAATPKYARFPFFGPADLTGVTACYTVTHTGSAEPTGIEVRLDGSSRVLTIAPPPEDDANRRFQHGCFEDLAKLAGTSGVGSLEHELTFALENKRAVGDRKDVTLLINVVGRLPGRPGVMP